MVATLALLGAMMAMSAGGAYFMMPKSIDMILPMFINLDKKGMVYPMFMNPPFRLRSRYMVFEITNKNQVLNGGKPKFGVRGPIYFDTTIFRDNISFHNAGQSVEYNSHRKLYLDEETSEDLDVKFWIFNPIVVGVADQVNSIVINRVPFKRLVEPIVFNSVNLFLDRFNERAIVKRSPREYLEGTKVDILEFITGLANQFGLGSLVPPGPPNNIFGIAYVQNETVDNTEIWTGVGESQPKFAEVISWHGHKVLPYWKGKCNNIEGTNGELYKPFVKPNKSIKIFLGPTCRMLILDPVSGQPVKLRNGMVALEFSISKKNFQAPTNYPPNECYCPDPGSLECRFDGLIRLGPCFFDSPVYFARANLSGADRRIRSTFADDIVNGTKLSTKQSFYLDPISSTPLKVDMTFMAVLKIPQQSYMRDMNKLQPMTFAPMFTATEALELPDSLSWQLKLVQKMYMENKPFCVLGVAGGIVTVVLGLMLPKKKKKANEATPNNKNNKSQDAALSRQSPPDLISTIDRKSARNLESGSRQHNPIIMADEHEYDYDEDEDDYSLGRSAAGSYLGSERHSTRTGRSGRTERSGRSDRSSRRPDYDDADLGRRHHRDDDLEASRSKSARDDYMSEPKVVAHKRRSARLYPEDYNYNQNSDQRALDQSSTRTYSTKLGSSDDSGTDHNSLGLPRDKSPSRRSSPKRRTSIGSG